MLTSNWQKSTLALRFRPATQEDVAFMASLLENEARSLSGVYANETFLAQRDHRSPIMKRTSRKGEIAVKSTKASLFRHLIVFYGTP